MEASNSPSELTLDDLLALPDDGFKYELQGGRLLREPPPGMRHGRVAVRIGGLLDAHVRRYRLGVVVGNDGGYVLARCPDTVRGPDVSFVARSRLARDFDDTKAFEGAPDLAIEVLSPSNRPGDAHAKVADYLAAGTSLVWVIDTVTQRVTVYRELLSPRVLSSRDMLDGADVVPGFSVPIRELFAT